MSIRSKKDLEIVLSKLKNFENPSLQLEQYPTPSSIAAEWIWTMVMKGDVRERIILDAACGPGILGIGLLLMRAKKVFFVDKDKNIMKVCKENYEKTKKEYHLGRAEFVVSDISQFNKKVNIVIQNPPFGTKHKHIDKLFLEKAFSLAEVVYSMHKSSTRQFVEAISRDFHFKITHFWKFEFPLKRSFAFHQKPVTKIEVGLWRMEKNQKIVKGQE